MGEKDQIIFLSFLYKILQNCCQRFIQNIDSKNVRIKCIREVRVVSTQFPHVALGFTPQSDSHTLAGCPTILLHSETVPGDSIRSHQLNPTRLPPLALKPRGQAQAVRLFTDQFQIGDSRPPPQVLLTH